MRRITVEEAAGYLAGTAPEEEVVEELPPLPPAAPEEEAELVELPVEMPVVEPPKGRAVRFSDLESVALVSVEHDRAAASIIKGRNPDRVWFGQPDQVYIGLGEGEVQAGDQFAIYRKENPVYDVDNGRFVGHYVRVLGWLEVKEVFRESALAEIRMSSSEIASGDRLIARGEPDRDLVERLAPGNVDGKVIFMPDHRTIAGSVDYVFLNRGSLHGLDPGILLEVYRPGFRAWDEVRDSRRRVPEDVVATITVVKSNKRSAVAFVSHTRTELEIGDRFRAAR